MANIPYNQGYEIQKSIRAGNRLAADRASQIETRLRGTEDLIEFRRGRREAGDDAISGGVL